MRTTIVRQRGADHRKNVASLEVPAQSCPREITPASANLHFVKDLSAVWSEHFAGCAGSLVQIGKLLSPDILVEAEAVLALP